MRRFPSAERVIVEEAVVLEEEVGEAEGDVFGEGVLSADVLTFSLKSAEETPLEFAFCRLAAVDFHRPSAPV